MCLVTLPLLWLKLSLGQITFPNKDFQDVGVVNQVQYTLWTSIFGLWKSLSDLYGIDSCLKSYFNLTYPLKNIYKQIGGKQRYQIRYSAIRLSSKKFNLVYCSDIHNNSIRVLWYFRYFALYVIRVIAYLRIILFVPLFISCVSLEFWGHLIWLELC